MHLLLKKHRQMSSMHCSVLLFLLLFSIIFPIKIREEVFMNKTYIEYKQQLQTQLKGHRIALFLMLFITSALVSAGSYGLEFLLGSYGLAYTFVNFIFSLFCSLINYVILFQFIKRVRNESFHKQDLKLSPSSIGALLVAGIILSIIQVVLTTLSVFLAFIPPLFYIVASIINVLCILWNSLIAYRVYDHETRIKVLIADNFHIIKNNAKTLLRGSLLYITWFVLVQLAIIIVILPTLLGADITNMTQVFSQISVYPQAAFSVIGIYILYYIVQFYLLVPLYTLSANVYEDSKMR